MTNQTEIGTTTWGKVIFSCKHWNLQREEITEDSKNGGYPIVARKSEACPQCRG